MLEPHHCQNVAKIICELYEGDVEDAIELYFKTVAAEYTPGGIIFPRQAWHPEMSEVQEETLPADQTDVPASDGVQEL